VNVSLAAMFLSTRGLRLHTTCKSVAAYCAIYHAFTNRPTLCLPVQVSWGTKSGFYLKSNNGTARSYIQVCERLWQSADNGLLMVITQPAGP